MKTIKKFRISPPNLKASEVVASADDVLEVFPTYLRFRRELVCLEEAPEDDLINEKVEIRVHEDRFIPKSAFGCMMIYYCDFEQQYYLGLSYHNDYLKLFGELGSLKVIYSCLMTWYNSANRTQSAFRKRR